MKYAVVALLLASSAVFAADKLYNDSFPGRPKLDTAVAGPPARAPDNVYPFIGAWSILKTSRPFNLVPHEGDVPLTPALDARRAELERMAQTGQSLPGRNARCIPAGMPDMMVFNFDVWATAQYMIVYGGYGTLRQVWLNRVAHTPADRLFPSYQGESIAHWEGGSLVIDTVGLDPTNEISYALSLDDPGMHIIEHWTLIDPRELQVVTTIESHKSLTRPYTYTRIYDRRPATEVITPITYCDRPQTSDGSMDLTPPSGGYVPPGADR